MRTLQHLSARISYLPPYAETDRPVLAAVRGEDQTLLIDAGNSSAHAQLFLRELNNHHIQGDWLVLTHWHWDHVFGMKDMPMPVISHRLTYDKIKEMQQLSWEDADLDQCVQEGTEIPFCVEAIKKELGGNRDIFIPAPALTFDTAMTIHLGGVSCQIEHVGGDHSKDSCAIYVPEEKVLFLGDCLYANLYADEWNYTAEQIFKLVQRLEAYEADRVFLSHHDAPLTKEEFLSFLQLLKRTASLTKKHKGREAAIMKEMEEDVQRELSEEERETITFFVNGYTESK